MKSRRQLRFIKSMLGAIRTPATGYVIAWDEAMPGLGLRVTANGTRAFVFRYHLKGRDKRMTLGKFPSLSVEAARKQVKRLTALVADQRDPLAERQRKETEGVTLGTALEAFLVARSLKPRTKHGMQTSFSHQLADWLDLPVKTITGKMVETRHRELGERSQAQANLSMRYLRSVLNFASGKWRAPDGTPLLVWNPVRALSDTRAWYRVERRRTLLKEHEIKPWWQALEALGTDALFQHGLECRDYYRLLLLTGLRRSEALELTWAHIDFKTRTLTVEDTKNREPHTLPLTGFLMELLHARQGRARGRYVFCGPDGKRISNFRYADSFVSKRAQVRVTPHDLRRTFATAAERLGIPGYTIKRLLNHKMAGDVTSGYIITDTERLRGPMEQICDFVLKAAGVREGAAVLPLAVAK